MALAWSNSSSSGSDSVRDETNGLKSTDGLDGIRQSHKPRGRDALRTPVTMAQARNMPRSAVGAIVCLVKVNQSRSLRSEWWNVVKLVSRSIDCSRLLGRARK